MTPETKPARSGRRYADHEIKAGLAAVLVAGSLTKASEQTGIPKTTLKSWKDTKPQVWAEVSKELAPLLDEVVLTGARELAVTWTTAERLAAQRLIDNMDRLDIRDLAGAASKASVARGIAIDKVSALIGRPTMIVEHRTTTDLVRELGGHVDGTAEEIS